MADINEVYDALRKADAAGDTESAQKLVDYIKSLDQQKVSPITAGGVARSALKGATLGWSDEMGAGLAALAAKATREKRPLKDIYSEMQQDISGQQKEFESQHPGVALGSEIAGGLAPAVLTMGMGAPAEAASLGNIAMRGGAAGTAQGAAYGAGTAEPGERMSGAGNGALVGGVVGAVLPPALVGAGRVASSTGKAIRNMIITPETRAQDVIKAAAERSGLDPNAIADKMAKLGPEATLADADENLLQQAVAAVNQFGPTKEAARELMRTRQLGEHKDTLSVLSEQLGGFSGDDLAAALKKGAEQRQSKASPLYRSAFAQDIPKSKDLDLLMSDPDVQNAMKQAEFFAGKDRSRIFTVDGNPASRVLNDTERLHYAKQALYDLENTAMRAGRKEEAKAYGGLRKEVTNQLDQIPEYKVARQIWSSSMEAENAGEVGKNFFKMAPGDFKQAVSEMNDHEKEMAKMGVMNAATEKAGATQDARSIAGMMTNTENGRQKIKALFGSEDNFNQLIDNAKKWDTFRHTANMITGGSPTAERLTAREEMGGLEDVTKPIESIKKEIANAVYGSKMTPEVARHIGEIMTKQGLTRNQIIDVIGRDNARLIPIQKAAAKTITASPIAVGQALINREE